MHALARAWLSREHFMPWRNANNTSDHWMNVNWAWNLLERCVHVHDSCPYQCHAIPWRCLCWIKCTPKAYRNSTMLNRNITEYALLDTAGAYAAEVRTHTYCCFIYVMGSYGVIGPAMLFPLWSCGILDPAHVYAVRSGGLMDPAMLFVVGSRGILDFAISFSVGSRGSLLPYRHPSTCLVTSFFRSNASCEKNALPKTDLLAFLDLYKA